MKREARTAKRHVILVGLPGSGKSTVGRLVAAELAAPFVDVDDVVELSSSQSIPQLFATQGEPAFRALEREAMERTLAGPPSVIAAGGGWLAQPGSLQAVGDRGVLVYLQVSPETAARRVGPAAVRRPLLAGQELGVRMRELYEARRSFYQRSHAAVKGDADDPAKVAREVVKLARSQAGWY